MNFISNLAGSNLINPKIGLLPTGLEMYWGQFPELKKMGLKMYDKLVKHLEEIGEVVSPGLVDTYESSVEAAEYFKRNEIDILLIFPFGYTTGSTIVPVVNAVKVPIRILNAHEDSSYDYKNADTTIYLHHEGVCCIPEYASVLLSLGKTFTVRTGHFGDSRLWNEISSDCRGAAAARVFKTLKFAVIGETYTGMTDMPIDEIKLLKGTGKLLVRPEVEEIEEAFNRVTEDQLEEMYSEFRTLYDVDKSVTNEHLKLSAQISAAFEEIIKKYDISAFGYYWWGQKEGMTSLRSQSALAVSKLAAYGRPGATEGDVKSAMAMKLLDLLGGGGMFLELFCMDFDENFIMMGHDGPSNINVASGKPTVQHLEVHHGKTGEGIGIDYKMASGTVTLVSLTQFATDKPFKLVYTIGELVDGDVLNIGNPNCRVKVNQPIHEFMNNWCQQGSTHHIVLGLGNFRKELKTFAEAMNFDCAEV